MRKTGFASLDIFYYDFREDQKKDLRVLSSVLVQLCRQSDSYCDVLSKLYSEDESGSQDPGDDVLVRCLKDLLELPGQAPIFLIVDALDECPNTSALSFPREEVLVFLEDLIDSRLTRTRVYASLADLRPTSRLSLSHYLSVLSPYTTRADK
jgi:hypothetical protein